MRHKSKIKKLGRGRNQRKALLNTLAVSLIDKESIKTTEAKAKALRPFVEKLITHAKTETLSGKRLVLSRLGDNKSAIKLLKEAKGMFGDRKGGYTRITKIAKRMHDKSPMAIIEFVK